MDLVFILDSSEDINKDKNNWLTMINFVKSIINRFPIGSDAVRVGLIKFSKTANAEFYLTDHMNLVDLTVRIEQIPFIGQGKNIAAGLYAANAHVFNASRGARPNVPRIAIIITNGRTTENVKVTQHAVNSLKERNVRIIAVGVTDDVDVDMLMSISSNSKALTSLDSNQLLNLLPGMVMPLCACQSASQRTASGYSSASIDGIAGLVYI